MTDVGQIVAYTLFCEDFRPEAGGKFSAIGVYPAEMGLEEDVKQFPKLVIATIITMDPNRFDGDFEISLWDRDDLLTKSTFQIPAVDKESVESFVIQIPIEACPFDAKVGMVLYTRITSPKFNFQSNPLKVRSIAEVDMGTNFKPRA